LSLNSERARDTGLGELGLEFSLGVAGLDFRASANMLSVDENVGHGPLAGNLLKGLLDLITVGNLVKLNNGSRNVAALKKLLGFTGEGAVRL